MKPNEKKRARQEEKLYEKWDWLKNQQPISNDGLQVRSLLGSWSQEHDCLENDDDKKAVMTNLEAELEQIQDLQKG